jgi:hypothetical protein
MVGGSGVMTDSLGVDTEEAAGFFNCGVRPSPSMTSGLAAAFITLTLGRVPRGAMFCTTPCRSIPASAKLGRGAGKGGSTHLSMKVLGFSTISAIADGDSADVFVGVPTKGLEKRERVGREFVLLIFEEGREPTSPPYFKLRPLRVQHNPTIEVLVLVHNSQMDYSILLYSSTACAVDKIVIRGERTCCLGEENEDAEGEMDLRFGQEKAPR